MRVALAALIAADGQVRVRHVTTVTISRSDGGSGPVPKGTGFTLQARVSGGRETAWKWKLNDQLLPDEASSDLRRDASDDTVGNYVAIATVNGEEVESTAFPVELGDAPTTEPKPESAPEVPPEYHPRFALVTAFFAFVLGVIVLWSPASAAWHVGKSDWKGTDGHLQLAATLGVPLTVLGGAAVVVGAWMAAVEWRGRFRKPPREEGGGEEEGGGGGPRSRRRARHPSDDHGYREAEGRSVGDGRWRRLDARLGVDRQGERRPAESRHDDQRGDDPNPASATCSTAAWVRRGRLIEGGRPRGREPRTRHRG